MRDTMLLCAALAASILMTGCSTLCADCGAKPSVRRTDHACLPSGGAPTMGTIPVMAGPLPGDRDYVEIANIDSYSIPGKPTPEQTEAQKTDLEAKGRAAGADAVIQVQRLNSTKNGWINNPRTPFPSVMQGETKLYFQRGVAIKFVPGGRAVAR